MRNIILKFLVLGIIINLLSGCSVAQENTASNELIELEYEEIADKLIRFHVLANSDSEEDQALKLKVRDAVIDKMYDKLGDSESLDDSRDILQNSSDEIIKIAKEVIIEEGFDYNVNIELGKATFPDKVYGNYIFEQGEYEAFRILIGSGQGENWWCVMFPPLCFVDESKEIIDSEVLEENLNKSENENNSEEKGNTEDEEIIFSFKIVELIKGLFNIG